MTQEAYMYKRKAKKAARDFKYPNSVIVDLDNAITVAEIERIMVTARKKYL